MASDQQINANRENSKLSQGPTTPEGKNISKMNAQKHGLSGATVLLPTDDLAAYENCLSIVVNHYRPVTDLEKLAVQEIADTKWRLLRIPMLEAAVYARGRAEKLKANPDADPLFVEAEILETCSKTLSNLTLQQSRLQRHLERKIKEFENLRAEREMLETSDINIAMNSLLGDPEDTSPTHPFVGSVFSFEFLASRLEFKRHLPNGDITVFDRAWRDKKAKTPA